MLSDWLQRDGGALLSWWLLIALAGVAVFPLMFRLMNALPTRGYMLARAAGLMLVAVLYWLLNTIGLLQNTPGGILLVWLIVVALGVASYLSWPDRESIVVWLRQNWKLILTAELLFAVMFVGWAIVRALNPESWSTEKPMEIAFLSATRRSAALPPHDPWMAGYDISYYYLGYVILAMLAKISGVATPIAFTLAMPTLFALTGIGVLGVVYDLITAHLLSRGEKTRPSQALGMGILAVFFVVLMGNLAPAIVEVPFQLDSASSGYLAFWDLKDRQPDRPACQPTDSLDPTRWGSQCYWWWFGYSRIVYDRDLNGTPHEIIDEMPQMSFIIFDDHPHTLGLPFSILVIGLGFNLVQRKLGLAPWEFLLYVLFVGGMIFLNSWDAVYIVFIIGAEALRRLIRGGTARFTRDDWLGIAGFAIPFVVAVGVLYLPFFIGFRSQAGGVLPNLIWPTRFTQLFLFFGTFLIILITFLVVEYGRAGRAFNFNFALQICGAALATLLVAIVGIAVLSWLRADPSERSTVLSAIDTSGGLGVALLALIERRLTWGLLTEIVLLGMIFFVLGRLFARHPTNPDGSPAQTREVITYSPATGFVLLLIAAGAVLALVPDFAYLKDGFGNRMNTVFKLYYQAWVMWSIASGFAAWSILLQPERQFSPIMQVVRPVFSGVLAILIVAGMVYPAYAVVARGWVEGGHANPNTPMTLDGGLSMAAGQNGAEVQADYDTIQCLAQVATSDKDVVLEATKHGLAYHHEWGRVSALTGIPTLLGWDNHEGQWRGDTFNAAANSDIDGKPAQNRIDVATHIYENPDWEGLAPLIKQYGITYIYVGPTEHENFAPAGFAKFDGLTPLCSNGQDASGKPIAAVYSVSTIAALADKTGS